MKETFDGKHGVKRSVLALCVLAAIQPVTAFAQETEVPDDSDIEVINVSGIRGSQEASIFNKRTNGPAHRSLFFKKNAMICGNI